jgi:hypothetical protein
LISSYSLVGCLLLPKKVDVVEEEPNIFEKANAFLRSMILTSTASSVRES